MQAADDPATGAGSFKVSANFEVQPWALVSASEQKAALPQQPPGDALAAGRRDDLTGMFGIDFPSRLVSGGTLGPDGRLYTIAHQAGATVLPGEKQGLEAPGEGLVMRSEPDGSHAEIFCRGLRDPHDLAFDNRGDLFTADAGSGSQGRWLYLLENGDYGWRTGWLHSALDPARVPWMAEKPWARRFDGQSAWALPPVANVPAGSWVVAHYPGTGFNGLYDDHFFVSNPVRRAIFFWCMRPNGAGFLFLDEQEALSGAVVREMAFRPGGRLEFVTHDDRATVGAAKEAGYSLKLLNAIPEPPVEEVARLLGGELDQKAPIDLRGLLKHPDQRIRLAAEWRLALSPSPNGEYFLREAALSPKAGPDPLIARVHAIWGLGIAARRAEQKAPGTGAKIAEPLISLLENEDLEVRSQAARVLGELRVSAAFDGLLRALRNPDERVSMFAAQALAKLGNRDALPQLILMLRDAGDHDPNLRQAYVEALLGLHDFSALEQAAQNDSAAVRMGALLAMRKLRRAEVARFLQDEEPALVLEAARAIHDENIASALPHLAALIEHPSSDEALMCRVLNASFRVGEAENATALANFAAREDLPEPLRFDALNLLARWPAPPAVDYVTGEPIALAARAAAPARAALEAVWPKFASATDAKLIAAAAQARRALQAGAK